MKSFFEIGNVMEWGFIGKILVIVLASWLPLFLFRIIKKYLDPSDFEKIMKTVKRKRIGTSFIK